MSEPCNLANDQKKGTDYCDPLHKVKNHYMSPLLFTLLKQHRANGTYRQGRVGVPTTLENALDKKKIPRRLHQVYQGG